MDTLAFQLGGVSMSTRFYHTLLLGAGPLNQTAAHLWEQGPGTSQSYLIATIRYPQEFLENGRTQPRPAALT